SPRAQAATAPIGSQYLRACPQSTRDVCPEQATPAQQGTSPAELPFVGGNASQICPADAGNPSAPRLECLHEQIEIDTAQETVAAKVRACIPGLEGLNVAIEVHPAHKAVRVAIHRTRAAVPREECGCHAADRREVSTNQELVAVREQRVADDGRVIH